MARMAGWVAATWAAVFMGVGVAAAGAVPLEYRVKAAFLYHFAQLTRWPGEGEGALRVCVLGEDPFGPALERLEGKRVRGRRISVGRCSSGGACDCEVVFVSRSERGRLAADLARLGPGVLTVSDIPGFAGAGGMIELVLVDGKVRFRINRGAAERAGLRLSSRLLHLAEDVIP